jgi:hypothetical protein
MLPTDDRAAAQAATAKHLGGVDHAWWDPDRALGRAWAPVLRLPGTKPAWDVYLVLGRKARWDDAPPVPAKWWHQLQGGPDANRAGPNLADALSVWPLVQDPSPPSPPSTPWR